MAALKNPPPKSSLMDILWDIQKKRRYIAPDDMTKIASEFHLHLHRIEELNSTTIVKVLERTDAFRKNERFEQFLIICEADFRGRTGYEEKDYPQEA